MASNSGAPTGPDVLQYLIDRSDEIRRLSPEQAQAIKELQSDIDKAIEIVSSKEREVVSESNQYERQYTSFLALSISFIVAGLLSGIPSLEDTNATKVFFLTAIVVALIAATFLAVEFYFVRQHFNKWQNLQRKIYKYILEGSWKTPQELHAGVDEREGRLTSFSKKWILTVEIMLILISFTSLSLWLVEKMWNPNWPIF